MHPVKKSPTDNQRKRIIEVASHLMCQKGYKGASFQEISDVVGIHKSTIFHYFKNKEELLLSVLNIGIEEGTKKIELIVRDKNLSPLEKLKEAIFSHIDSQTRHSDNASVYHSEIRFLSQNNRRKYLNRRKHYAALFEQLINEIKESDDRCFRGLDAKIVTFGILGMCNWVVKWYRESAEFTPREIAHIFYNMIIPGKANSLLNFRQKRNPTP